MADNHEDPSSLFLSMMGTVSYGRSGESTVLIEEEDEESEVEMETTVPSLTDHLAASLTMSKTSAEAELRNFVTGQITFSELAKTMEDEEKFDDEDTAEVDLDQPSTSSQNLDDLMPKPRRRRNPRKTKLDIVSQNLLGSAELSSARGNVEDAIKMCLEVIKENPKAHEPYQTLAHFYDDLEDFEKAFQYHMIAAYLCPRDLEGWMQVAELALERKDLKNAILCYSKAIRINPEDFSLRLERSKLYEEVKDIKKAICGYEDVIGMLKEADGEDGLKLATRVARMHFENNSCVASIQIIEKSFQKFEQFIVSENVNMYIELLISEKLYVKAMQAFTKYCGVEFLMSSSPFDETLLEEKLLGNSDAIEVVLQFDVPIDLKSKLVVCLIHLRCFKSVKQLQQAIEQEDAEEMGDLYLDIAEAYMDIASYPEAEPFLRKLVNTQNYNLPAVWLRHARCLKEMQELEQSIEAYYKVVHYAANHFDARLELSDLLLSLNRSKEATEVSLQSEKDQLNIDLLLVRCRLLYDQKQYAEFAKAGRLLLSSDMIYLTHPKELTAMITSSTYRTRLETLRDVHKDVGLDSLSLKKNYVGNEVEADELFDIYAKVCRVVCFQLKDYKELERIVLSAYTCGSFVDREQELDFFALMSMYISRNKEYVYKLFKAVVGRSPNNNQVWNVFSPIMSRFYQDLRHNRFCLRLFVKHPDLLPLAYFNGHNALMSGSYKHALAEYINIYKQDPNDAFAALCVSLGFLHLACQKFMSDKNSIVCQLAAFLDIYVRLRGECQESLYNAGRAFHQLGLVHNAVTFYKRALDCPVNIRASEAKMPLFSLNREIGYNLSLIYRSSGSPELALDCLRKYCTV